MKEELRVEKEKSTWMWRMNCDQVSMHDALLSEKEAEIDKLKKLLEKHDGSERSSEASLDDRSELSITPLPSSDKENSKSSSSWLTGAGLELICLVVVGLLLAGV